MDKLLAKPGTMRDDGKIPVITYLRKKQNKTYPTLAREEEEVRTCEGNNTETPRSVEKEGQEVLQVPELRFLCRPWCHCGEAAVALQPVGIHRGCRDPHTACGDPQGMQRSTHSLWGSTGDAEIHTQPVGIHRGCRDPHTACGDPQGMQRSTHSPWGSMGHAEIHLEPVEEVSTPEQMDAWRL
ncbi:hypothetical protein DUI87_07832 [Hirundo rustica rustica]|uniref:Uncharacterized protein n=1 Tax=Hirundo rustica rustica TaxID=333673 RepID=A0A3M0KXZ8_HIRRU|nr:hypothetical protein DUI87_07832 [Hirundo rustica rustica]